MRLDLGRYEATKLVAEHVVLLGENFALHGNSSVAASGRTQGIIATPEKMHGDVGGTRHPEMGGRYFCLGSYEIEHANG
jgi:hypothetical protein